MIAARGSAYFAGVAALAWAVGCGPSPAPIAAPLPVVAPVVLSAAPTATAVVAAAPKEALPQMHPCIPDFIVKELHSCEPGAPPADYSAVANAMTAMTAAGPMGPIRRDKAAVQRPLQPPEQKAAAAARAFLCIKTEGEPDDEHATVAFDLGRLFINANHFEEAAVYLRDVAVLDPQKHAEVEYASRFLLDAVRALAGTRPECKDAYAALASAVDEHVCKGAGAEQRAETCEAIAKGKDAAGQGP